MGYRTKKVRKVKEPSDKLLTSKPMAQMRDIAFGKDMVVHIHRTQIKQESRNDEAIIAAAEAKRQRKAAKVKK